MNDPNDKSAYSRDKYKARPSSYRTTRPASKYAEVRSSAKEAAHASYERSHAPVYAGVDKEHFDRTAYASSKDAPASHTISSGNVAALRRRRIKAPLVIGIILVVVLLALSWWLFFPKSFDVTVNGQRTTVSFLTTLQDLVNDGYASPKAGNLVAVDGSVITEGGGETLHAVINDEDTADPNVRLSKDAVITISDGHDVEEEYEETLERVPFDQSDQEMTAAAYYVGPIHVLSEGSVGSRSVRTGSVSGITTSAIVEEPIDAGFLAYTPDVGDDKVIALTFDDGPWPVTTKQILEILKQNDAHATFFTVGEQCESNASVMKELAASGNQIATHSYDHANGSGRGVDMTLMSAAEQIEEIEDGFQAIEDVLGHSVSRIMRAPGGNYYGTLVTNLAPYVDAEIGWNVDSRDWTRPGVDAIVQQLLTVEPGQVILMHDGGGDRSQTVEALRQALPILKERGFKFVTIDQLLEYGIPR